MEKNRVLSHSPHPSSLFHAKETEALALRNMCKITNMESKTTEETGIQQEALQ